MSAADVVAVVLAVVLAGVAGAVVVALLSLSRTLRALHGAIEDLRADTLPIVEELREAVTTTVYNVERVDRLVASAEAVEGRVDAASRLAYRTIQSPVVKAMALSAGVQRTAQRLVGKEPPPVARRRRFRRRPRATRGADATADARREQAG
jgi:hypothetical protein